MTFSSSRQPSKTPLLIVAEDDLDDRVLLEDALAENDVPLDKILFVGDGQELIDTLSSVAEQPIIILLDLNMPRLDGREALRIIKSQSKYKQIPVLIFTTSNSQKDIDLTYYHGANSYFTKPISFGGLTEIVELIKKYWFEQASLPVSEQN